MLITGLSYFKSIIFKINFFLINTKNVVKIKWQNCNFLHAHKACSIVFHLTRAHRERERHANVEPFNLIQGKSDRLIPTKIPLGLIQRLGTNGQSTWRGAEWRLGNAEHNSFLGIPKVVSWSDYLSYEPMGNQSWIKGDPKPTGLPICFEKCKTNTRMRSNLSGAKHGHPNAEREVEHSKSVTK